jgi:hypothetical protein
MACRVPPGPEPLRALGLQAQSAIGSCWPHGPAKRGAQRDGRSTRALLCEAVEWIGDEDPASGKAVLGDRGQRHGRISGHRKAQAELGVRTTAPQPDPPDTRSELPRIGLGRSAALTQFRFLWVIYSTGVVARRAERFLPRIENPPNANVGVSQSDHSKSAGPDSFRSPGSKFCLRPVLLMSIYSSVEDR